MLQARMQGLLLSVKGRSWAKRGRKKCTCVQVHGWALRLQATAFARLSLAGVCLDLQAPGVQQRLGIA